MPKQNHKERRGKWILRGMVMFGVLALLYYFDWWRMPGRIYSPWLGLALLGAALYNWSQLIGNWVLYLAARRRPTLRHSSYEPTVDLFVTAYKEPRALVERSLAAACAILVRAVGIIWIPVIAVWLGTHLATRGRWLLSGPVVLSAVRTLLPWEIVLYRVEGRLRFVTTIGDPAL